jgi:hypothetical protein
MTVRGGLPTYGHVAGILMLESATPRVPGDPGHAATFSFPVLYEIVKGFTLDDLRAPLPDRLGPVLQAARRLEERGVSFVTTDCGLFSLYQEEIASALHVPFLASGLLLGPLLTAALGPARRLGIITGHTGILTDIHLRAAGIDPERVAIVGMEGCPEFVDVVIDHRPELDVDAMREGTLAAAGELLELDPSVGALLLECTNLVTFRPDLVRAYKLPVFDLVTLIEMFADSVSLKVFSGGFAGPAD